MNFFVLAFVCALTFFSFVKADNAVGHPIAVVPGIIGTALHGEANNIPKEYLPTFCPRNHKEFSIWVNLGFDFNIKCFRHYMEMHYNSTTNTWGNTPGVTITVPQEGTMHAVDIIDGETTGLIEYFHPLIKALEARGFQDGVNMSACGYDWRHLPTPEWANKCRGYIERMVKSSGKKAILIGHSMGGPFSYYVLKTAPEGWVSKYIHKYVTAAPAWMGAPRALDALFTGLGDRLPSVLGDLFAPLSRSIPGVWFLFPWDAAFNGIPAVKTPGNTYSYKDVPKILNISGLQDTQRKYDSAREIFAKFNNYEWMPEVPVISVYGVGRATMMTLIFKDELKQHAPEEDWKHPSDYNKAAGDGTVPDISAGFVTNNWMKKYPDRNITIVKTDDTTHQKIVMEEPFIGIIVNEVFHDYN